MFKEEKPGRKSGLWKRLRRCKGGEKLVAKLQRQHAAEQGPGLPQPGLVAGAVATTGTLVLVGFVASLVAGIVFYAVYKGYEVELEVERGDGATKAKLRLVPRNKGRPETP